MVGSCTNPRGIEAIPVWLPKAHSKENSWWSSSAQIVKGKGLCSYDLGSIPITGCHMALASHSSQLGMIGSGPHIYEVYRVFSIRSSAASSWKGWYPMQAKKTKNRRFATLILQWSDFGRLDLAFNGKQLLPAAAIATGLHKMFCQQYQDNTAIYNRLKISSQYLYEF